MQITLVCLGLPDFPEFIVETPEMSVANPQYVIGRASDCDLQISSLYVSRHHCELLLDHRHDAVRVRDLGSQNGTFVNRKLIREEEDLKDGDKLELAGIPFEIHIR